MAGDLPCITVPMASCCTANLFLFFFGSSVEIELRVEMTTYIERALGRRLRFEGSLRQYAVPEVARVPLEELVLQVRFGRLC